MFHLSVVIVGYDFGATKGTLNSDFLYLDGSLSSEYLLPFQYGQWIGNARCTDLITLYFL